MSTSQTAPTRKRPVNLTLNDDLVQQAKVLSGNLSATVEELLTEYVACERNARQERRQAAEASCREWNAVLDAMGGSFADDHSTL